jgi:hypothetical protein
MATGGVLGNGVRVGYSAASPVSFTRVPQLLDVTFPTFVYDEVDSTVHGTSKLKRSMPGMITVSEMTMTFLSDLDETTTASQQALFALNQAGTSLWWRVEVPVNREQSKCVAFEFQGFVKSWEPSTPIEDRQTLQVVVKFDGDSFTKYAAQTGFSLT